MKPPRIALFTDSFHEVNGVALTSRQFEDYARRHDFPMFSCHAGPETRTWTDGYITRCEWKRSPVGLGLEADLSFDLAFLRYRGELRKALRRFAPDYVHVTAPSDCGMMGALLAHELNIPVAASWHTNIHEFGARRLERLLTFLNDGARRTVGKRVEDAILELTLLFYRLAKVLFAPNPELVRLLESRLGKPCGLMSRGIDTNLFDPAHRDRHDSVFRIGYVGRLSAEKNLQAFVELERMLLAGGRREFEIRFVGHGSMTERLKAVMTHAHFTGVRKGVALAKEYANFDLFVFPSRTDTFGNVVLEAMASGVPAVVTDAGGPQYLVQEGVTGYVTRGADEMTDRVCRLMDDGEQRSAMSRSAREYTLSHHDWDSVFASVYTHYSRSEHARRCNLAMSPVPGC